jgi:hypothetical protein
MAKVRVLFENPGWFLLDVPLEVRLGDRVVHQGSFKSGFDATVEVPAGSHPLTTSLGGRSREYAVEVGDAPDYVAELHYSRVWGNFTSDLSFQAGTGDGA